MLSENVLIESSTARSSLLSIRTHSQSLEYLNKAKAVIMATWQGTGYATAEQAAEYYEVKSETVKWHLKVNKEEFGNELKNVAGDELRQVRELYYLTPSTPNINLLTPRGMHRLGFMLRDSEVAKEVRNVTLDVVEAVPNNVDIESKFIKDCKDLKQMQDVLGLSNDDPDYRQALKSLMVQRFGNNAIATPSAVVKSKPIVNYTPATIVVETFNIKAECFVAVANTVIKVYKQKLDGDLPVTAGLLTRYSRPVKNLNKIYPEYIKNAMQILYEAGHLRELGINCRSAMNYKVVKLPTSADIKALTPA